METLLSNQSTSKVKACNQCHGDELEASYEFNGGICNRCASMNKLKYTAKTRLEERQEKWILICPERYRENEVSKIDELAFNQVFNWKMSKRGIICHGHSMRGKTTSCWKLLEKLFILQGVHFLAYTEAEFSQQCSKLGFKTLDWLTQLSIAPLLFIDDLGNAASSARHLEDLYFVIEKRTAWRKPVIITTQYNSEELTMRGKGAEKITIAILNRLKFSCEMVKF